MTRSVVLRGPVLTQSGYGVHARQIARWLLERHDVDVCFVATPWGDTPWLLDQNACSGLVGEIMKRSVSPEAASKKDVSIQLQLPNEWDAKLSRVNVGVTAAVETDRCHPDWIAACNSMDAIIVPSQHSAASLTNTGAIVKPLHIIPEAFSDAITLPELDRKSTRLNSSHVSESRMPSSA